MPDDDQNQSRALNRRRFLGRAALGGAVAGAAWVAPAILTLEAAAAGTCGAGGTLDWANVPTGAPGPSSVTVGVVTVDITHTDPNGVGSAIDFQVNNTTINGGSFGGQNNPWYQLQIAGAATGNLQTATFKFSTEVNSLSFTFFDIDQNTTTSGVGRYRDVVSIAGSNALNAPIAFTPSGLGSVVTGAGTTANPFTAVCGTNNTTTGTGNATIKFNAPVKTVTITYSAAAPRRNNCNNYGGAPWASQRIGIGNLSWNGCT